MTDPQATAFCCLLGAIEVLGLASAWFARLSDGCRPQRFCQRLFIACLVVVGASTIVCIGLWPACWLGCGVTMSLMVLTVTCDFRRHRPATAW
jgi:hypothetical protein